MPNVPPAGCCVKVLISADNANAALYACLLLGVHHLPNAAHLHLLLVQAARTCTHQPYTQEGGDEGGKKNPT